MTAPRRAGYIAQLLRDARRSIPLAAFVCALVATLNAVCWSLITPPFQVPDEPSHFAYVKQLAEAHALPSSGSFSFSAEEDRAITDLHEGYVQIVPPMGTIVSLAQERTLERDLTVAARLPREGSSAAGVATSQPPFYYLLETIPYALGWHGTLLTRLELMRLLSALFAGVTALFVFLFVREALPGAHAAWAPAALSIAFAPLLGFMSGAVNPDSLLFAISAAIFWCMARAFRFGLTDRLAALLGVITVIGLLTKLNFVGLFPGIMVGVGILAVRRARLSGRASAYRAFGLAAGIAAAPIAVVALINLTTDRPALGFVSTSASLVHGSLLPALSYTWQLFLPRLPGMRATEPGIFTTGQIWFDGLVGQYGWLDVAFPEWVYLLAWGFGAAVLVACGRTLVVLRKTVRARVAEITVYLIISGGLLMLISAASYFNPSGESYTQARYLLPLLALAAALLALAIRAAGRRWEGVLGTVVVLAIFADDIFSQLLVIARYYG